MRNDTLPIPASDEPAPRPGKLIGATLGDRYKLVSSLGSGAMGDVYLAEHVVLGKRMAVKVLKQALTQNEEVVRRFQQEAISASRIGQENIVDVTDFGRTADGSFYFVMEALDGSNLRSIVSRDGALSLRRALPLLMQVCRALAAAHARGIVHRDLKLDNVMVVRRDDGTELVKVLDFGISKVSAANDGEEQRRITQAGMVLGTPDYMSPEQIRGEPIDLRADIYAFGVVAFEVATGTVPFPAPSMTAVMMKHLGERPQPPGERRPELLLPPAFDALVLRALEKDREHRFQSMAEVKEALVRCLEALGGDVQQPPAAGTPALPAPTMATPANETLADALAATYQPETDPHKVAAAVEQAKARRVAGRRAPLGAALAVGGLVLAVGAAFVVWRATERPVVVEVPAPVPLPPVVAPAPALAPPAADPPTAPPPAPKPAPAAPVLASLGAKDVVKVLSASQHRVRKCMQDHRDKMPAASGRVEVSITIAANGSVRDARVKTPLDDVISSCIVTRLEEMRFPKHVEASQTFDLPFAYAFQD